MVDISTGVSLDDMVYTTHGDVVVGPMRDSSSLGKVGRVPDRIKDSIGPDRRISVTEWRRLTV